MARRGAGPTAARPDGERGDQFCQPGETHRRCRIGGMTMRKRLLGQTGVLVSEFALGTMTFGQEADESAAGAVLDHYVESGGNLIDTADVYPPVGPRGASEEIIGRWLDRQPGRRDSIILATKCRGRMDDSGNSEGLSRCSRSTTCWLGRSNGSSSRCAWNTGSASCPGVPWARAGFPASTVATPPRPDQRGWERIPTEVWRRTRAATSSAPGGSWTRCRRWRPNLACLRRGSPCAGWPTGPGSPPRCLAPGTPNSSGTTSWRPTSPLTNANCPSWTPSAHR